MPHVLIDAQGRDVLEPGLIRGHRLEQRLDRPPDGVPGRAELAGQATHRGVLTTQLPDRPPPRPVVSSARGAARSSCCSVNAPAEQDGSSHRQVRLRQISSTGRPKQGTSTSRTSRRPWLWTTTPHVGQPTTCGGDSTTTRSPGSVLGDLDHVETVEPDQQVARHAVGAIRTRARAIARRRLGHRRGLPVRQLGRSKLWKVSTRSPGQAVRASRSHPPPQVGRAGLSSETGGRPWGRQRLVRGVRPAASALVVLRRLRRPANSSSPPIFCISTSRTSLVWRRRIRGDGPLATLKRAAPRSPLGTPAHVEHRLGRRRGLRRS